MPESRRPDEDNEDDDEGRGAWFIVFVLFPALGLLLASQGLFGSCSITLPSSPDGAVPPAEAAPNAGVPKDGGTGGTVQETIWKFLRANGLTREQAAGVMGNAQAESGFRPGVEERTNRAEKGIGTFQWTGPRRDAIERAARAEKVPVSDLNFQLRYMYGELIVREIDEPEFKKFGARNEWELLKKITTVEDALVAFHHEFERSKIMNLSTPEARRSAVIRQRLHLAMEWYNNPNFQ